MAGPGDVTVLDAPSDRLLAAVRRLLDSRDGPRDLAQYRYLRLIRNECNVRFQAAYNIKTTTAATWSTTIPWIAYDANYFDRNPFPR